MFFSPSQDELLKKACKHQVVMHTQYPVYTSFIVQKNGTSQRLHNIDVTEINRCIVLCNVFKEMEL